jgi:hypothetical protein
MHSLITATTLLILFAWAQDQVPPLTTDAWGLAVVDLSDEPPTELSASVPPDF